MTVSESDLRTQLATVQDPELEDDIVSLGLVNDVSIEGDTARISLAFNAPYAPAEMTMGNRIREVVADLDADLEADVRAHVGEDHGFDEEILPRVKNVIAVSSGKGGVGKTTVAANLAAGLEKMGARVGILDSDIHGPNVPRILPIEGEPGITPDEELVPPRSDGVRVISMGFLTENADDPAILRGPMVNNIMTQFLQEVEWGVLDYLIVDLPPGTGDATLNLLQLMPVAGAVIVTTPQQMAVDDTRKGLRMFQEHDAPILGIVENMSTFRCPNCDDQHDLFGRDGGDDISADYDVPLLAKLPLDPEFGAEERDVPPVKDDSSSVQGALEDLIETVADRIGEVNRARVADATANEVEEPVPSAAGQ
ncbi:Mrp/NBP35 family ATP-binding protein [Natronosalvus rutilus]|uniref:Iron-sulfur cluster carrier protein n=1 Tax=Natronosalvus rutilus TaxID=2953753 RepID=A0A9E7SUQ1_9EURY|nr:Mrp/NBP35 family ATP-binding protein [Natronosalvus rutilus]UTF52211.1 Mrp/NBP35 family ATP-binding protein [Natronosalvus rutilus]